jgi:predicted ATP-binding protein involved in virulence
MNDKVENTLICPNQLRANGIIVDDVPIHLSPAWQPSTHSILATEDNIRFPVALKGVISFHTDTRRVRYTQMGDIDQ